MPDPAILLLDNGSLAPAATLNLRTIAKKLSDAAGKPIAPVSLLHSSTILPEELDGQPAEIFEPALEQRLGQGLAHFLIIPLFFGPSNALADYLPRRVATLKKNFPPITVRVAPPLVDLNHPGDIRWAAVLEDRVRAALTGLGDQAAVVLVDHGSPVRKVAMIRDLLAAQLQVRLGRSVRIVRPASMERRPDPQYSFGDPLLEQILDQPGFNAGPVVIAMLFLSPGRHAGPQGDVMQIVAAAKKRHPDLQPVFTELVGTHPGLLPILLDRMQTGLGSQPL